MCSSDLRIYERLLIRVGIGPDPAELTKHRCLGDAFHEKEPISEEGGRPAGIQVQPCLTQHLCRVCAQGDIGYGLTDSSSGAVAASDHEFRWIARGDDIGGVTGQDDLEFRALLDLSTQISDEGVL